MPAPPPESEPAIVSAIGMDEKCAARSCGALSGVGAMAAPRAPILPVGSRRRRRRRQAAHALFERLKALTVLRQPVEDGGIDLRDLRLGLANSVFLERV